MTRYSHFVATRAISRLVFTRQHHAAVVCPSVYIISCPSVCPSICLSVTPRNHYCTKTAKCRLIQTMPYDHRLRGSASPVLTATGFVNGKGQFSTPHRIDTPQPITKKFVTGDYVGDPYGCAKLGAYPSKGSFWAHG